MADEIGGRHADAFGRIVEDQQLVGRQRQQRIGRPASRSMSLSCLEVGSTRIFEQGDGRVHQRSIIHSLNCNALAKPVEVAEESLSACPVVSDRAMLA